MDIGKYSINLFAVEDNIQKCEQNGLNIRDVFNIAYGRFIKIVQK